MYSNNFGGGVKSPCLHLPLCVGTLMSIDYFVKCSLCYFALKTGQFKADGNQVDD